MQKRPIFYRMGGPGALLFAKRQVFGYYLDSQHVVTTRCPSFLTTANQVTRLSSGDALQTILGPVENERAEILGRDLLPSPSM